MQTPLRRTGNSNTVIVVVLVVGGLMMLGVFAAIMLPAFSQAREAARRSSSKSNLKQYGVATHNYHDVYSSLPLVNYAEAPSHSWHTLSLPFIEQANLFQQIDRTKEWDDPANKPSFELPIQAFLNPGVSSRPTTGNGYAVAQYELNTNLVPEKGAMRFRDITDGTSRTLLSGEVNSNFRAWGDPAGHRDLALGINTDPNGFGSPFTGGAQFLYADGSVRFISESTSADVLKALGDPTDGRAIDVP